jgi:hypothetical protein
MNGRAISQESFKYTPSKYNEPRYNDIGLCDTSPHIVRYSVISINSSPFTITFYYFFHSRTVHLDTNKVFYLPTDAQ